MTLALPPATIAVPVFRTVASTDNVAEIASFSGTDDGVRDDVVVEDDHCNFDLATKAFGAKFNSVLVRMMRACLYIPPPSYHHPDILDGEKPAPVDGSTNSASTFGALLAPVRSNVFGSGT